MHVQEGWGLTGVAALGVQVKGATPRHAEFNKREARTKKALTNDAVMPSRTDWPARAGQVAHKHAIMVWQLQEQTYGTTL